MIAVPNVVSQTGPIMWEHPVWRLKMSQTNPEPGGRLRNKNKIPSGNETWQWKIRHIGKSLINGPFSIAIFDYQRVSLPITEAVSFLHQVCDESTSQMPPLPRNRSIPGLSTKQAIL